MRQFAGGQVDPGKLPLVSSRSLIIACHRVKVSDQAWRVRPPRAALAHHSTGLYRPQPRQRPRGFAWLSRRFLAILKETSLRHAAR